MSGATAAATKRHNWMNRMCTEWIRVHEPLVYAFLRDKSYEKFPSPGKSYKLDQEDREIINSQGGQ